MHILLTGRAREWFWRYRKQVDFIDWKEFCQALKYQYGEVKSTFDIHEDIRNCKMKANENFETFYDSVCILLDKLSNPIPEKDLVEILLRNLRLEIRHELLYVHIFSIAHLRKLVQMRENLLENDYFRKNIPPKYFPAYQTRRQVAEVEGSSELYNGEPKCDAEMSVDAIQKSLNTFKCWNCDQSGHQWEDCLETRNIFCYGCGMKNTYKPQCTRCADKKIILAKNLMASNNVRNQP